MANSDMAMKDKIETAMKKNGFKDPIIFEKTIYAFRLLNAGLSVYPNLIFKGGTSIFLHQFPPVRFSIDIDILLSPTEIEFMTGKINSLVENSRKTGIPKKYL
jgi:predicted nucleotidyltransferase component of viral defense system